MREFVLEDPLFPNGSVTITCQNDRDCIFCDHCTDIWGDYSHPGFIWGITCKEGHDPNERPCQFFVEDSSDSSCSERRN